jgi:N-hydroxyarylamine O-acetyltransferase
VKLQAFDVDLRDRYLRHLGFEDGDLGLDGGTPPGPPSLDLLRRLHHAQLDRVPYENLEIQLGRPTTIDPNESARRIVTGRGGYCYHLNGSFAALLLSLGFEVALVRGAPLGHAPGPPPWGAHMVLVVRIGSETWIPDVGLGDGFRDPLPLAAGPLAQEPFAYRLEPVGGPVWRFHHDPRASIAGFDFDVTPVPLGAFAGMHEHLSTSPESSFVQKLVVQRRYAGHAMTLRGCVLTRADATGRSSRDVVKEQEWTELIRDEFGLRLTEGSEALHALWTRVRTAHEAWDRAGRR